jgi:large repetitive protein
MPNRTFILAALGLAATFSSSAHSTPGDRSDFDAYYRRRAPHSAATEHRSNHLVVTGLDRQRQVPSFVWASPSHPLAPSTIRHRPTEAARHYLAQHAALYRISQTAIQNANIKHVHDTGRGGILVKLQPRVDGLDVFQSLCNVLLGRDGRLIAIAGSLRPETQAPAAKFRLRGQDAVARAFRDRSDLRVEASNVVGARPARGGYVEYDLYPTNAIASAALSFASPARSKRIWFPLPQGLVPAFYVELDLDRGNSADADLYAYVVAADSGKLLYRSNKTHNESFNYRVFAENSNGFRPLDGPVSNHTPHPTGQPDASYPAFVSSSLVSVEGLNQNPNMAADPWLSASATETRGNNVDAYTDNGPQGFSSGDLRAQVTSDRTFDHLFDTAKDALASEEQRMAAVTQLFFVNNWLHDYYYDSGFNEEAGNGQQDNYGRGGLAGDPLLAEGQDRAPENLNNANMSTPADGKSPRMQMFVYSGKTERNILIPSLNQSITTNGASFGPGNFDVTAPIALADDGVGDIADACESIGIDLSGKIALIRRGTCSFISKVQRASAAGAAGVIIANNNANEGPPALGGNGQADIGALSVTKSVGQLIENALLASEVSGTIQQLVGPRHDGTIDNLIIAHEWGHYLHHRLVRCSSRQCGGQSEGFGDFLSLMTMVREEDDLDGTFSAAVYAPVARADAGYFGIRRAPYSVDFARNGFTFRHIQRGMDLPTSFPRQPTSNDNAEVHNSGEIWASMLFEGFVGLLKRSKEPGAPYNFDQARRRMADYLVAGLKLTPKDPTFTEQRDAILAAAAASDFDDMLILAKGFARRGAGSCASSPVRDSQDNLGVVESYEVGAAIKIVSVELEEASPNCDADGVVDAGEDGILRIELSNIGPVKSEATRIQLSSSLPELEFLQDAGIDLPSLQPLSSTTLEVRISLSQALEQPAAVDIDVSVEASNACSASGATKHPFRLNYDNKAEASDADDFESDISVWVPKGLESGQVWARETTTGSDRVWHGIDTSHITDTHLLSPPLSVRSGSDFGLRFVHRHSFEVDEEPTFWDGGVIELSSDEGVTWQDVLDFADPGYAGPLSNEADNPLSDRPAFSGQNPSWPDTDTVDINFGAAFAGKTVLVRFRIGTDQAVGNAGWFIHEVAFTGLDSTPFPKVVEDESQCVRELVANAGPDQESTSGATVVLDGSETRVPNGQEASFVWRQLEGPDVALESASQTTTSFVAPDVQASTKLRFELRVQSGEAQSVDEITVRIEPSARADALVVKGGCGCHLPARKRSPSKPLALALSLLGLAWRRRRQQAP